MRRDESLGECITVGCERFARYANTLECQACYKRRRRAGKPPVVIEGVAKRRMASYRPHKDGRTSNPAKKLIGEAREAFLLDSGYLVAIAEAMAQAKRELENAMEKYGFTFEEALEYVSSDAQRRQSMRVAKKYAEKKAS